MLSFEKYSKPVVFKRTLKWFDMLMEEEKFLASKKTTREDNYSLFFPNEEIISPNSKEHCQSSEEIGQHLRTKVKEIGFIREKFFQECDLPKLLLSHYYNKIGKPIEEFLQDEVISQKNNTEIENIVSTKTNSLSSRERIKSLLIEKKLGEAFEGSLSVHVPGKENFKNVHLFFTILLKLPDRREINIAALKHGNFVSGEEKEEIFDVKEKIKKKPKKSKEIKGRVYLNRTESFSKNLQKIEALEKKLVLHLLENQYDTKRINIAYSFQVFKEIIDPNSRNFSESGTLTSNYDIGSPTNTSINIDMLSPSDSFTTKSKIGTSTTNSPTKTKTSSNLSSPVKSTFSSASPSFGSTYTSNHSEVNIHVHIESQRKFLRLGKFNFVMYGESHELYASYFNKDRDEYETHDSTTAKNVIFITDEMKRNSFVIMKDLEKKKKERNSTRIALQISDSFDPHRIKKKLIQNSKKYERKILRVYGDLVNSISIKEKMKEPKALKEVQFPILFNLNDSIHFAGKFCYSLNIENPTIKVGNLKVLNSFATQNMDQKQRKEYFQNHLILSSPSVLNHHCIIKKVEDASYGGKNSGYFMFKAKEKYTDAPGEKTRDIDSNFSSLYHKPIVFLNGKQLFLEDSKGIKLQHNDRISFGIHGDNHFVFVETIDSSIYENLISKDTYNEYKTELSQIQKIEELIDIANYVFKDYTFSILKIPRNNTFSSTSSGPFNNAANNEEVKIRVVKKSQNQYREEFDFPFPELLLSEDHFCKIIKSKQFEQLSLMFGDSGFNEMKKRDLKESKTFYQSLKGIIEVESISNKRIEQIVGSFENLVKNKTQLYNIYKNSWISKLTNTDEFVEKFRKREEKRIIEKIRDNKIKSLEKKHQFSKDILNGTVDRLKKLCDVLNVIKKKMGTTTANTMMTKSSEEKERLESIETNGVVKAMKKKEISMISNLIKELRESNRKWDRFNRSEDKLGNTNLKVQLLRKDDINRLKLYFSKNKDKIQNELIVKNKEIELLSKEKTDLQREIMKTKKKNETQKRELNRLRCILDDEKSSEVITAYPEGPALPLEKKNDYFWSNLYHVCDFVEKRAIILSKYEMGIKKNWI